MFAIKLTPAASMTVRDACELASNEKIREVYSKSISYLSSEMGSSPGDASRGK